MRIKGVSWAGVKTDRYEEMTAFFRDVAGIDVIAQREDFAVFRMPDGDQVEIFGPRGPDPAEQFARNDVVAGLLVDDIVAATEELRRAGIELLGDPSSGTNGSAWQHFRAPDGKVFELCSDPGR